MHIHACGFSVATTLAVATLLSCPYDPSRLQPSMQASAKTSSSSSHGFILISKQPPNPLAAVWGCTQASLYEQLLSSGRPEGRKKVRSRFSRTAENTIGTRVVTDKTRPAWHRDGIVLVCFEAVHNPVITSAITPGFPQVVPWPRLVCRRVPQGRSALRTFWPCRVCRRWPTVLLGGFWVVCRACLCLLGLSWLQASCASFCGGSPASSLSSGARHLRACPRDRLLLLPGTPILESLLREFFGL
ncbi:hypothetical protein Taro_047104 [Colocasia esculenta]|uniref:Secreted protein n=1 Tax=Colocasia esculenta TaxID=4460 RepID=A0A843X6U2_COLES|nr:hypothetical protein [Colocasia esculenta]